MRFSIQWWGFSSGWRWPGHSPFCVIRAGATLTVLICRGSTRCRRWLRFLLKVCNNDCQISHGNFQMLSATPIHIFQSWPGFLMTVLFASCFLFTFFFFYFIFFLFLWLCRGYKLLRNLLCNQLGDRSRFPGGGALPHIAHHALEGLGAVPEGADATVPVTLIRGRLRLPLRPGGALLVSHDLATNARRESPPQPLCLSIRRIISRAEAGGGGGREGVGKAAPPGSGAAAGSHADRKSVV